MTIWRPVYVPVTGTVSYRYSITNAHEYLWLSSNTVHGLCANLSSPNLPYIFTAHLQSTYPAETQFFSVSSFSETDLRRGSHVDAKAMGLSRGSHVDARAMGLPRGSHVVDVKALTAQTAKMGVDSPAANTRSRRDRVRK